MDQTVMCVLVVFSYLVVGVVAVSMGLLEMVHACATFHLMAQLVSGVLTALLRRVQYHLLTARQIMVAVTCLLPALKLVLIV